jgi:hypothetical protein
MDHTMVLSYDYSNRNRRRQRTNAPPSRAIWWPWRWVDAIWSASPNAAWPGLHRKPLDAAIGLLLAPYYPMGRQGGNQLNDDATHVLTLLAVLMAIAMRQYYTASIPRWRRFVAFINATKRRHRASTCSDMHQTDMPTPISGVYFIIKLLKKSSSCPNNNRGVTHQTDEKHLHNLLGWLN